MNWETLSLEERIKKLDELKARLETGSTPERLIALNALLGCRLDDAVAVASRLCGDTNAEVSTLAKQIKTTLQQDIEWFGQGALPHILLPPPVPTLAEEAKTTRLLWILWTVGGFLTVTTLLIREHTGALMLPLFGTFVLTLGMLFFTRKLAMNRPSPGCLYLDVPKDALYMELLPPDAPPSRTSSTLSAVHAVEISRTTKETHPEDPPQYVWIARLEGGPPDCPPILIDATREALLPMLRRLEVRFGWKIRSL